MSRYTPYSSPTTENWRIQMTMPAIFLFTLLSLTEGKLPNELPPTPTVQAEDEECVPVVPNDMSEQVIELLSLLAKREHVPLARPFWVGRPYSDPEPDPETNQLVVWGYVRTPEARSGAANFSEILQKSRDRLSWTCFDNSPELALIFDAQAKAPLSMVVRVNENSPLVLAGLFYASTPKPTPDR